MDSGSLLTHDLVEALSCLILTPVKMDTLLHMPRRRGRSLVYIRHFSNPLIVFTATALLQDRLHQGKSCRLSYRLKFRLIYLVSFPPSGVYGSESVNAFPIPVHCLTMLSILVMSLMVLPLVRAASISSIHKAVILDNKLT